MSCIPYGLHVIIINVNTRDKIRRTGPEKLTLRELRRARKITQVRMAKALGVTQDSVSRLERRSDTLLSTLRKVVKAMGGNLSLVAEFPDRRPVVLSGIGDGVRLKARRASGG